MNTTIEAVLYTSKKLSNGLHPLMLRLTKNRKRKYISLHISLSPEHWDTEKCKPKRNCPKREQIEKLIKLTNIKERTIRRSIRRLEESRLLAITTHFSDETTRHNTYYTDFRMRNFFMLDREFFQQGYDPKIAGFLLLLKCVCINGTNTIS